MSTKKLRGLNSGSKLKDQAASHGREGEQKVSRFTGVKKALHNSLKRRRLTQSNFFKGIVANNPRYDSNTSSKDEPRKAVGLAAATSDKLHLRRAPNKKEVRTSGRFILESGFNFSSLELSPDELVDAGVSILMESVFAAVKPGLEEARIVESVREFVEDVQNMYVNTSYHSFFHAIDVMQSMYFFLSKFLHHRVNKKQRFMLVVIGLVHDIGHPGAGIKFLHDFGLLKQFRSLEAYHVFLATELIQASQLFSSDMFDEGSLQELLDLLEFLVLATDMSMHKSVLTIAAQSNCPAKGPVPAEYLSVLIKLCDVCNVVRHFKDAKHWSINLNAEFASLEKLKKKKDRSDCPCVLCCKLTGHESGESYALCVEQEVLMRAGPEMKKVAEDTIAFIGKMVVPIINVLEKVSVDLYNESADRLKNNLFEWRVITSEAYI